MGGNPKEREESHIRNVESRQTINFSSWVETTTGLTLLRRGIYTVTQNSIVAQQKLGNNT